jgi:lipopolysaccharide/colanic/teichoic acid biosynthesis glycosyltransferase
MTAPQVAAQHRSYRGAVAATMPYPIRTRRPRFVPAADIRPDQRRWRLWSKRALDVLLASALLALSLPLLAAAALVIRITTPGPVIFRQRRVGLHGAEFTMFKLRTMCDRADRVEDVLAARQRDKIFFKKRADPRVTSVGRVLRKYSIDELPQFYNVLRGDMSIVGPRPLLPCDWQKFPNDDRRRRAWMKPGLTGLWQVNGRSLCSDHERMRLDVEYVDRWALTLDLQILLRTPLAVLSARGAF